MKKAKANTTVKIRGKVYVRGTEFSSPYPQGVQREIDAYKGLANPTVSEFEVADPKPVAASKPPEPSESGNNPPDPEKNKDPDGAGGKAPDNADGKETETEAGIKKRLIEYALAAHGEKLDGRKSLADIEARIAELDGKVGAEE